MKNIISIKKRFLAFREEAEKIGKIGKKTSGGNIYFDFSKVDFVSRSFADELLNVIRESKRIKIINLKPHLANFFEIVKNSKEKIRKAIEK